MGGDLLGIGGGEGGEVKTGKKEATKGHGLILGGRRERTRGGKGEGSKSIPTPEAEHNNLGTNSGNRITMLFWGGKKKGKEEGREKKNLVEENQAGAPERKYKK